MRPASVEKVMALSWTIPWYNHNLGDILSFGVCIKISYKKIASF
jgi:hypothetical protein